MDLTYPDGEHVLDFGDPGGQGRPDLPLCLRR